MRVEMEHLRKRLKTPEATPALYILATFTGARRERVESEIRLTEPDMTAFELASEIVWATTAPSVQPKHQHVGTGLPVPVAICNISIKANALGVYVGSDLGEPAP